MKKLKPIVRVCRNKVLQILTPQMVNGKKEYIKTEKTFDKVWRAGKYIKVRQGDCYGVFDRYGNQIFAPEMVQLDILKGGFICEAVDESGFSRCLFYNADGTICDEIKTNEVFNEIPSKGILVLSTEKNDGLFLWSIVEKKKISDIFVKMIMEDEKLYLIGADGKGLLINKVTGKSKELNGIKTFDFQHIPETLVVYKIKNKAGLLMLVYDYGAEIIPPKHYDEIMIGQAGMKVIVLCHKGKSDKGEFYKKTDVGFIERGNLTHFCVRNFDGTLIR